MDRTLLLRAVDNIRQQWLKTRISKDANQSKDLLLIGWWGLAMDYPCAKFGGFSFSRFGFIVQTHRQTHKESHTDATMNE